MIAFCNKHFSLPTYDLSFVNINYWIGDTVLYLTLPNSFKSFTPSV